LIISSWTFSMQLGASTTSYCLSQCAIPFCTLLSTPVYTIFLSHGQSNSWQYPPLKISHLEKFPIVHRKGSLGSLTHFILFHSSILSFAMSYSFSSFLTLSCCYDQPHFIQVFTMMQLHGQLLYFILLYISNSSVSASLVGHVLYSADLMFTICFPHLLLMVHRYIYSRYSPVFGMLYQLYHFLPSSTLISSSSLYLSVATWVTP